MPGSLIASSEAPLVVGLGSTGLSCVRFFRRQGVACSVVDSRENPPGLAALRAEHPEVPVTLGALDAARLKQAGRLVVSPGVALEEPAVAEALAAGVPLCGDIDLFCQEARAPVVGITGSNGKSTVTDLLGRMANRCGKLVAVGGNLGTPALDLLDDDVELYVLELSSFQLERAGNLGLAVATVLNMSADHLDRHGSMQRYHHAKQRIYRNCKSVVFNREDPLTWPLQMNTLASWNFGMKAPDRRGYGLSDQEGETWIYREFKPVMRAAELRMPGRHNLANALAALALADVLELPLETCLQELREYPGLPHRSQLIDEFDGVRFINDSKATNPGATLAAIAGFAEYGPLIVILGGQGKGADFAELCHSVSQHCKAAILIGEAAGELDAGLAEGPGLPRVLAGGMNSAVAAACEFAQAGDIVLLSPACASFDMFENFVQRGEQFISAVAAAREAYQRG